MKTTIVAGKDGITKTIEYTCGCTEVLYSDGKGGWIFKSGAACSAPVQNVLLRQTTL